MKLIVKFKKEDRIYIFERVNTISDLHGRLNVYGTTINPDGSFTSGLLIKCDISEIENYTILK